MQGVLCGVAALVGLLAGGVFFSRRRLHQTPEKECFFLQKAPVPWCFIPLDKISTPRSKEPRQKYFTYSDAFCDLLGPKESWEDLVDVLGRDVHSPFQQGLRTLLKEGKDFSVPLLLKGRHYLLKGTLVPPKASLHVPLPKASFPEDSSFSFENFEDIEESPAENTTYLFLSLHDRTDLFKLQNEAAQESEQKRYFLALLNALPVPIWHRNEKGELAFCNNAYAKILETQPHHVLSRQWDLIDGGDAKKAKALFQEVLAQKKPQSLEVQKICKGEAQTFCLMEGELREDRDAKPYAEQKSLGTLGCAFNVSKYKTEAAAQAEERDQLKNIFYALETPLCLLEESLRVTFFNQAFENVWGTDLKIGPAPLFLTDIFEQLRQEDKLPEYIPFSDLKNTLQKWSRQEDLPAQEMWHMPSGAILNLNIAPCTNASLLLTVSDITQTLNLESRYKALKSVWDTVLEHYGEAVLIVGQDNRIQQCNQKVHAILQRDPATLSGMFLRDFIQLFPTKSLQWRTCLEESLELRYARSFIIPQETMPLLCEYTPLPDGDHMIRFSDATEKPVDNPLFALPEETLPAPEVLSA
ncbi:hypothetical protein AGMMS49949_07520 [Alphaproteobacteria bacterium]|nr:hypothetical protein AGMMS49949_07520 [Alphaproteobacteria bacterium]GHS98888.1 hypothetical protein AGMMS50296_6800 [Alphaproteobacteria bacterium]